MNILVSYNDTARARAALAEACRMATPGDAIIVVAPITVPAHLPLAIPAGMVWKQSCVAERCVAHAREETAHCDVPVRFVQVRARDDASAIITAATHCGADLVLFAAEAGVRHWLAAWFGVVRRLAANAPCGVRLMTIHALTARNIISPPISPMVDEQPAVALQTKGIEDRDGYRA